EIAQNGAMTLVSGSRKAVAAKGDTLIEQRKAARARKDWKEADRIRDELKALGAEFEDKKDGTTIWINRPDTSFQRYHIVSAAIAIAILVTLALAYWFW